MITINNLTKKFDDFVVLSDLSLHVRKGTVYGLVGPNGAGKTTLIQHIAGIYPSHGEIKINGADSYENEELKQRVVYIPDEPFFYGSFSVKNMADFYSSVYKNFNWGRYELLKQNYNFDETKQVNKMSKGMKKQIVFWLSLCAMPDVLILDEPIDGLDPVMRRNVWNIVMQDVSERKMTVLISSHNLRELEEICDDVGIMNQGKIIIEKDLNDLKGCIHKIQVVFKDGFKDELKSKLHVLDISNIGSVYSLIVKDDEKKAKEIISEYGTTLVEEIGLTLEEIFIYELGGMGYEFENIIV